MIVLHWLYLTIVTAISGKKLNESEVGSNFSSVVDGQSSSADIALSLIHI